MAFCKGKYFGILACALLLLLVAQWFYVALSLSALYRQNRVATISLESILLDDVATKMGMTARFGSDIGNLRSYDKFLNRVLPFTAGDQVIITEAQGQILASKSPLLSLNFQPSADYKQLENGLIEFEDEQHLWLGKSIESQPDVVVGYVYLSLSKKTLTARPLLIFYKYLNTFLIISLITILLFLL